MYCICCKQNSVKPLKLSGEIEDEEYSLWLKEEKNHPITGEKYFQTINNQMVSNGIIQIIDAGFGSSHDGLRIIIAICDSCINENLEDATLLYFEDYMIGNIKEKIEKSKKIYRRRKNLDNISNDFKDV